MKTSTRIWLTAFFAFGTIMWSESINGGSWQVSMLVANLMTLLALCEVFGDARPFQVGLYAGAAAISRYDLCLVWPVYFVLLVVKAGGIRRPDAVSDAYRYALGLAPAIAIYIGFNECRFGTLPDTGLWRYDPANGNLALTTPPTLFAWRYFPGNFFTLFYMAPTLMDRFPWIRPLPGGQSILTTSPAFLLALRARFWKGGDAFEGPAAALPALLDERPAAFARVGGPNFDAVLIAAMALLSSLPVLFYVGNGMSQFGTRHFVQCFPFLVVLMALGGELDQMGKVLIVVSVCLIGMGILAMWRVGL